MTLQKFLVLLVVIYVSLATDPLITPKAVIKRHVQSYGTSDPSSLCDSNTCCTVSDSESCSLTSSYFTPDSSTVVLPGGSTRCIFSTSTPFGFQVIPGESDKLLFYFQGGGACWSESTTSSDFCTTDARPQSLIGVFDRTNVNNKYKNYTIVHAMYCSGDIWAGDIVRDYNDDAGVPVTQKGQANGQATLDWVKQQQDSGELSSTLSELVVMGCSAGSIGTQLWAKTILDTLKWEKAAVIPDSYAGIFPEGTQGPLVYSFGMCSWSELPKSLYDRCINQKLTLQEFTSLSMKKYENIPYAFIQSKTDDVQRAFYMSVGESMNATAIITPSQFYDDVNLVFSWYNKNNANFITYLIDGDQHCFTPLDLVFTADGLGAADNNSANNTGITMIEWLNEMPLSDDETVDSLCLGTLQSSPSIPDNTYCSNNIVPKEFVEEY